MQDRLDIFISSTSRDLPTHRKEAMDACLRMGMFPIMMEHLPASDVDAIQVSLRMVDDAEIYLGIFASRYGYIPHGQKISITEMEYNRAVARGIPRLIFMIHGEHETLFEEDETERGILQLDALKERLKQEKIVNFFKSPEDLRAQIIHSLVPYRRTDILNVHSQQASEVPPPPIPYIAHPYTLLQTDKLIGRQDELNLLMDWVARRESEVHKCRVFNFVAIGGMGKSALTWTWFNDLAPMEMNPLAGRIWWSFYESDAHFDNFVTRSLAYITKQSPKDVEKDTTRGEREDQLLAHLDKKPFLIVLDGLERLLNAYARMDAAYLADDDLDEHTANRVAGAAGLINTPSQLFIKQQLRKTTDPRVGNFLRKLAAVRSSRILVSTRLYPADLQTDTGYPIQGSFAYFMPGLKSLDALKMWHALGVSGTGDKLLPMFDTFDNHPLLIRAMAGEVARFRRAPGDFNRWGEMNPGFDPFQLPMVQRKSHVMAYAMAGLTKEVHQVLQTVAAFRMPATYDSLVSILVGDYKPFANEYQLDIILTELEDRGLLGWDKRSNRYDLHPIVRGVAWNILDANAKKGVYEILHTHFQAIPTKQAHQITSIEDLVPAIELYNTLIGMGNYDEAYNLLNARLKEPMYSQLSEHGQLSDLLEMLFPDGLNSLPRLTNPTKQATAVNFLANCYIHSEPGRAIPLYSRNIIIRKQENNMQKMSVNLGALSYAFLFSGRLYMAEVAARQALIVSRELRDSGQEATCLYYLGLILGARGQHDDSEAALKRALQIYISQKTAQSEGLVTAYLAQNALWGQDSYKALQYADRAWVLAHNEGRTRDLIRAARLQGLAHLQRNNLNDADERLHYALVRAKEVRYVEEELQALTGLSEIARQQQDFDKARECLDDQWELIERGPYPLIQVNALNVLAQLEADMGFMDLAAQTALKAARAAACDGVPYAYQGGLNLAHQQLQTFNHLTPRIPQVEVGKRPPMPQVDIVPL